MPYPARDIRETFLAYFEGRGHRRVASSSVVPESDPTLMFTNAGMVQFKRTFLGEEVRDYTRATTSQKCIRVSGKHNDLENVGRTPRHHTFFEMLGNFSFGDYFKEEAIEMAWELLTEKLPLRPEQLAVSVFREDDEAFDIWRDRIGIPEEKIYRLDEKENFWSMGDTGPCGPCSEIHNDFGRPETCTSEICDPSCECGRWLEIWNLVFMQFNRDASGEMTPLPKPSIDTGGGLERWAAVLQGKYSNYDSDAFTPILARAQDVSGVSLGDDPEKDVSLRVVADHARACAVMIGDGVLPSNAGRGYVLRRILRRAARHGVLLGVEEPFLHQVSDKVIDELGPVFPELIERRQFITERIKRDEERFLETLSKGLELLKGEIEERKAKGETSLPGETVFKLYDTFGFPVDLTADILVDHDMQLDQAGFDTAMGEQRARARAAWKGSGDTAVQEIYGRIAADLQTEFRGYETLSLSTRVAAMLVGGQPADRAEKGQKVELLFDESPFYAESGGQVGDRGVITTKDGSVEVSDVQKPVDGLFVHHGTVTAGVIEVGAEAQLDVDAETRAATVRNHTGTHLLHAALREVLGPQAMQKGSLVSPGRLRFDFTHDAPVTRDELVAIEDRVNVWIEQNAAGLTREMGYKAAIEAGAVAIFDEKYGDRVRVVSFGDASTELCGGTHAKATGDIGLLKIVSEAGIAAGIRRIEAVTGIGAIQYIREQEEKAAEAARLLKVPVSDLAARIEKLLEERKQVQKELESLRTRKQGETSGDLLADARDIGQAKVLAAKVSDVDAKAMRTMVDDLRNRMGPSVVCLIAEQGDKVLLAIGVTPDLTERFQAGKLIKAVAGEVGGGGGGRPDFAQAGGKDASRIPAAIEKFYAEIEAAA